MEKRRGTDDETPSPSVERNTDPNFVVSSSNNNLYRDNNLRVHRDQPDNSTGTTERSRESRRDENPFSFKHFLKKDAKPNYNLSGARPKVYSPARTSPSDEEKNVAETDGIYPRNPTELPDFVQDHLVIEQCYLNREASASSAPLVSDADNLPDFTINNSQRRQTARTETEASDVSRDLPFDLTGGLERRNRERSEGGVARNETPSHPRPNRLAVRRAEPLRGGQVFPFDLPSSTTNAVTCNSTGGDNISPDDEAGVAKSLPDFLNDGPIRNRVGGSAGETDSSLDMPERRDTGHSPLTENERLRDQLKIARQHIADKMRMIESLKSELAARRAVDRDETKHLERAMEQVQVNLQKTTKRASNAENAVALLKQEVKALTAEVSILRSENRELRSMAGAGCSDYRLSGTERRIKKLSDELRAAATTAEASLRQLMTGVDNLKVMASALENVDRIEDRTKDFLPDFEEENAAGPAL